MRPGEIFSAIVLVLATLLIAVAFYLRTDWLAILSLVVAVLVVLLVLPVAIATMEWE